MTASSSAADTRTSTDSGSAAGGPVGARGAPGRQPRDERRVHEVRPGEQRSSDRAARPAARPVTRRLPRGARARARTRAPIGPQSYSGLDARARRIGLPRRAAAGSAEKPGDRRRRMPPASSREQDLARARTRAPRRRSASRRPARRVAAASRILSRVPPARPQRHDGHGRPRPVAARVAALSRADATSAPASRDEVRGRRAPEDLDARRGPARSDARPDLAGGTSARRRRWAARRGRRRRRRLSPAAGARRRAYRSRSTPLGTTSGSCRTPSARRARASRARDARDARRARRARRRSSSATRGRLEARERFGRGAGCAVSAVRRQISESRLWKSIQAGAPAASAAEATWYEWATTQRRPSAAARTRDAPRQLGRAIQALGVGAAAEQAAGRRRDAPSRPGRLGDELELDAPRPLPRVRRVRGRSRESARTRKCSASASSRW